MTKKPTESPEDAHTRAVLPHGGKIKLGKTPVAPGSEPATTQEEGELLLPHERDQSDRNVGETPDPVIQQAKRDIDAGLVDTDMRATPGLDAERRERLVPGPGGKPPLTRTTQPPHKKTDQAGT
ncbi:MAG: hypothetical protein V4858_27085 [Pseudomonadota bacterium]